MVEDRTSLLDRPSEVRKDLDSALTVGVEGREESSREEVPAEPDPETWGLDPEAIAGQERLMGFGNQA